MFSLDMRTAIFSYVLITIISTFFIILLLKRYRDRYNGVLYMLFCFVLQSIALIFILLRGNIPDWISFDLSNTISVAGIILFYLGIESYLGKKSSLIPNIILLILFVCIHTWFTFGKPDLAARHLNIAVVWLIIFVECTWLLSYRVPKSKIRLTLPLTLVCFAFDLVCIIRIIKFFLIGHKSEDYFNSDLFDTTMILISQVLLILLTYSLEHMFGNQLILDIKSEEEKFSKAFNTSPYGIILTCFSSGQILDINKGFQNTSGYSKEELLGKSTIDLNFWLSDSDSKFFHEEFVNTGKVDGREFQFMKKSGELITCLISSEAVSINKEDCILSSINDISSRKKYERELIISKEKAQESDRLKTAFIQNISHEIRTPLNSIVGFSTLMGQPDLDPESKESFIEIITKSSDHLLAILTDIMEISNIEAGLIKLKKTEIDLNVLLNDLYKQFKVKAHIKGIDLIVTTDLPDSNSRIMADRTKLIQVLSNLLSNALNFTDFGQIKYGYKLKNSFLEFYVKDTGIGIPDRVHDKIFDRFYQVDNSNSRPYDGIGLGLSISKSFIELCGGKIWLESKPGDGTIFYFMIPYSQTGQLHEIETKENKPEY